MPPKNAKKSPEDAAVVDIELVGTLSPFEKQMMEKFDKKHGILKELSKNVSKISTHLTASDKNIIAKEVVYEIKGVTAEILKEMSGSIKDILKGGSPASSAQTTELQVFSDT